MLAKLVFWGFKLELDKEQVPCLRLEVNHGRAVAASLPTQFRVCFALFGLFSFRLAPMLKSFVYV